MTLKQVCPIHTFLQLHEPHLQLGPQRLISIGFKPSREKKPEHICWDSRESNHRVMCQVNSDCRRSSGIFVTGVCPWFSSFCFTLLWALNGQNIPTWAKTKPGIGNGASWQAGRQAGRGWLTLVLSPSTSRSPCPFVFCPSLTFPFLFFLPSQGCQFLCSLSSNFSPFPPLLPLAVSVSLLSLFWAMCMCPSVFPSLWKHACVLPVSLPVLLYLAPLLCGFSIGYLNWEPEDSASGPGTILTSCAVTATLFHISGPQVPLSYCRLD